MIHEVAAKIVGGASVGAAWDMTFGHTGRNVRGTEEYARVEAWSKLPFDELMADPAFEEFKNKVQTLQQSQMN